MGKALFRNSCQRGLLTIFSSTGSKPLSLWDAHMQNGYYKQYMDPQIKSMVFEIGGTNVSTAYITCPKDRNVLGIVMPYLVMVVKNIHKYWSFEITILDDQNFRRRFRASNFQSTTQINQMSTAMPLCLAEGWNQIQFNLADFTYRAYAKRFCEVLTVKVNANICIRRIYFAERLMPDHELPKEYKLFLPLSGKPRKRPSRDTIANELQEIMKKASEVIGEFQETKEKPNEITNETQETTKNAGEITNEPQETMKKASDTKLEELKEASRSKGSMTSNVSKASITQTEVTSKHSGAETVEIAPVETGVNDENDPEGTVERESLKSNTGSKSSPPRHLEDVPEEDERALVE